MVVQYSTYIQVSICIECILKLNKQLYLGEDNSITHASTHTAIQGIRA